MVPLIHILTSFIPFVFLFPFYNYLSFAFFIGSVLIDIDHYFWYVIRFKDFSVKRAYEYYLPENRPKREKDILNIFHVWEFWILILALSFVHIIFLLILLGMIFHLTLDFIDLNVKKTYGARAISYFYWLKRH